MQNITISMSEAREGCIVYVNARRKNGQQAASPFTTHDLEAASDHVYMLLEQMWGERVRLLQAHRDKILGDLDKAQRALNP